MPGTRRSGPGYATSTRSVDRYKNVDNGDPAQHS